AAVVCMYDTQKRLVSHSVDIREVRAFLSSYFSSIGSRWEDPPFVSPTSETEEIQRLISDLTSPNNELRLKAVRRLGMIGPDAKFAVPALLLALSDRAEAFRQEIANALEQIGPPAPTEVHRLVGAMRGNDPIARLYAARAWSGSVTPAREALPLL